MLPMLPMQRVSGSGSGRALSAALLSRECIMCSRDCGSHAVSRSSTAEVVWSAVFHPALTPAATATGWMQAPEPERSLGA